MESDGAASGNDEMIGAAPGSDSTAVPVESLQAQFEQLLHLHQAAEARHQSTEARVSELQRELVDLAHDNEVMRSRNEVLEGDRIALQEELITLQDAVTAEEDANYARRRGASMRFVQRTPLREINDAYGAINTPGMRPDVDMGGIRFFQSLKFPWLGNWPQLQNRPAQDYRDTWVVDDHRS
jgi:hypothetical protein